MFADQRKHDRSISLLICVLGIFLVIEKAESMTHQQMEKASRGMRSSCQSKIGTNIALIEGIRKGEFPEDRSLQCYIHCILKLTRSMNKQDQIDLDMTVKQIQILMSDNIKEAVINAAEKCAPAAKGNDPCELAASFAKCNYYQDPTVFFFP